MVNLAALRAAVFSLSAKNLRGTDNRPPAVCGLIELAPAEGRSPTGKLTPSSTRLELQQTAQTTTRVRRAEMHNHLHRLQ